MGAAITIEAANRCRCAASLRPCLFRRNGFDQKKTLIVPHTVVLSSHPLDHLVLDINRIKRHTVLVPRVSLNVQVYHQVFASQAALTRQELLSNIEQSQE